MDFNNLDFVRWEAPATAPLEESGVPPLPTGIKDLDDRIGGGLRPGNVYRLSGRLAQGKTQCALAIARCVSLGEDLDGQPMKDGHNRPHPVMFISLELPMAEVVQRLVDRSTGTAKPTRLPYIRMVTENLSKDTSYLARAPIFVDATAPLDVRDILTSARDMKERHGIELVIIDYLQLCSCREFAAQGRRVETSAMLHCLTIMARVRNVAVIVLEQTSHTPAEPADKA